MFMLRPYSHACPAGGVAFDIPPPGRQIADASSGSQAQEDDREMKLLLTGAAGFIGYHTAEACWSASTRFTAPPLPR
jgi:hypothetical protein